MKDYNNQIQNIVDNMVEQLTQEIQIQINEQNNKSNYEQLLEEIKVRDIVYREINSNEFISKLTKRLLQEGFICRTKGKPLDLSKSYGRRYK